MPPTCESLLEQITYNLKISSDTFNTVFPGVSTSRRFLESVRNLSLECGNWDTIQHLLQTARKHRHGNKISTVSRTKQWVPWDAQEAEKMWNKNPSTATKNTAIECATGQKVHVIFCGVSRYSDLGTAPSEFISIPVYPFYSAYEGKFLQYFTREYLENLEHDLGRGLVAKVTPAMEGREGSHDDGEYFLVHQIVLAMIAAKESGLVSMELRSPKWVSDMVATHELPGHVCTRAGRPKRCPTPRSFGRAKTWHFSQERSMTTSYRDDFRRKEGGPWQETAKATCYCPSNPNQLWDKSG
ncbi:hypothetical protein FPOA_13123 [Fusarium poae]|uniref:Uncharacterized protein n=1 Tax=Fusarium poae TaxID=36050 RepID=A0A1B8A6R1_FUSPO|nr:hypothetical protein FPOA_13129 [Fusarium poae]OBS16177.1 hypothetical protein FPOA_13123 [Fusarium poae]